MNRSFCASRAIRAMHTPAKFIRALIYRPVFLLLDIWSLPTVLMSKKQSARYHLKYICPLCPKYRRMYRDVHNRGECWWHENWKSGRFDIPKTFCMRNWIAQYFSLRFIKLEEFKKHDKHSMMPIEAMTIHDEKVSTSKHAGA